MLAAAAFGWITGVGTALAQLDISGSPSSDVTPSTCHKVPRPSASAIATNSTSLDAGTLLFQARFRGDVRTGQLVAYDLTTEGSAGAAQWDAAAVLPPRAARNILTRDGTVPGGGGGIDFLRDDLRESKRSALGDIGHSDPQYVGALNFGYESLPIGTPGRTSYRAFVQSKLDSDGRALKPMLYVGANDGMLHGFDAETGVEQFAYVPSTLIPKLNEPMEADDAHRYFVDGHLTVGDAYIDAGGGAGWVSVLVGTTGAGGRTVFALDVSDPHSVRGSNVLWEFTDPDLGLTTGEPTIARMADGTWAAVFGNGYNSDRHRAVLFVVRLEDGVLLRKIDTGIGAPGSPNGLATPSLLADGTRTIQTMFAGDLQGNLWAFDVSARAAPAWKSKYHAGPDPAPLFTARDPSGNVQPITVPIDIGSHPDGGYMLYFGTGRYLEANDNSVGPNPQ
ncbi:MAG TPA: PilC/PilY family type IV pilus protein, partial [Gammaproteobacteria bacterium]|nr:PilC/PilY family type IV pilus protein [Gammaproteobacteria bacterium]